MKPGVASAPSHQPPPDRSGEALAGPAAIFGLAATISLLAGASGARASEASPMPPATASLSPQPAPAQPSAEPSSPSSTDQIIVIGRRRGEAAIAAETELREDEIAAYGAPNIGALLGDIAPLIGGKGETPELLVNGKRIGSVNEIKDYPPEALERVAVLPPEASAQFGFSSGKRVVNLELKPRYASWDTDIGLTVPTAGGRRAAQTALGRTAIDGDTRWTVQASLSEDSALRRSARRLPVRDDVLALVASLSPASRAGLDPQRFETVVGAARALNINAGVSRPIGRFSASFGLNASFGDGKQLIGLPAGSIILPPGSRWTDAGAQAVAVGRLLGIRALESRQRSNALGASAALSGAVAGWQTNVSFLYSRSTGANAYDRGFDVSAAQARVDADDPAFDPYGDWPGTQPVTDRSRFRNETMGLSVNGTRQIFELPAGPAAMSVTLEASRNDAWFTTGDSGSEARERSSSARADARWSLLLPVASRGRGALEPIGDLEVDITAEAGTATRTSMRRKWNFGVHWSPIAAFDLRANVGSERIAPTFDQLYGPRIEIVSRMFDFARQEYAQPTGLFGGNPDLASGRIETLSLNAMLRPLPGDIATLTLGYRRQHAKGAIASFPALTPDVEAAFPDRVVRDTSGRLTAFDARPVNISRDRVETLATGLTLRIRPTFAAPDAAATSRPWTLSFTVNHGWQLRSDMEIRPGLPVIDRLRGSGQPRHILAFNLVAGRPGFGATLDGSWSGGASVSSASGSAKFRYEPSMTLGFSAFVEPAETDATKKPWYGGLRISLDIRNLLNGYRKISIAGGTTPGGFSRDEIDPLGRTVRLSVRKQF